MQEQEINKIKELVKTSSLLIPLEKEEWLALTGIMNDKQLLELRRILETTSQESGVRSQESKIAEIPPLTHIMNLPKGGAVFPKQELGIRNQELSTGQKTGFWKKIRDVLAEKELPPGHAEAVKELELPAPNQYQVSSIKYQAESKKSDFTSGRSILPKPPIVPKPAPKPVELLPAAKPASDRLTERVIKPAEKQKFAEEKLFVPGLKDTKVLMDAKLAKSKVLPLLYSTSREASSFAKASEDKSSDLRKEGMKQEGLTGIINLEQVSRLASNDISKDLSSSLKHIAANVGYHKLLQTLEKSPMFAAYIKTGLAALLGQRDLEETSGDYLNRQEFERFVDVLREIKI